MDLTAEKTLLVASVAPASNAEAFAAAKDAASLPEGAAVELRLDAMVEMPEFGALRAAFGGRALIATVRSVQEGGSFRGTEDEERDFLEGALAAGFDFVDVEYRRDGPGRAWPSSLSPSKKISSLHDTEGIPADLDGVVARMLSSGARFVKLVATANDTSDVAAPPRAAGRRPRRAFLRLRDGGGRDRDARPVAVPRRGALVRRAATRAARRRPGQIAARDLADVYGVGRPRRVRRVFALLGDRVSHSLSPALHNANFEAVGQDALYVPFALRALGKELPRSSPASTPSACLSSRRP